MKENIKRKNFFKKLYLYSLNFVNSIETQNINTISFIKKNLFKKINNKKENFISSFPEKKFKLELRNQKVVGMNTIGLLLDRMTILSLKINLLKKILLMHYQ